MNVATRLQITDTLPKLLKYNFEKYGDKKVAMRVKDVGIWQEYTWKDYYENTKYFSLGLISLGLNQGDRVSVLGENKPQWYWAELAIQAAGGVVVGIFTDCMPSEVKYYVEHSDSKFAIAHDQEQVDKLLQIKDELPLLKKIIYWDPKGIWNYKDPILTSFNKVLELGRQYEELHPGLFEASVDSGQKDDVAMYCYTSGTTGLAKAAMLTHNSIIGRGQAQNDIDQWDKSERYVSFLPPAWVVEQQIGVAGSLLSGIEINFPERPETVQDNIREIAPEVLFWGPRNWESVNRLIQAKMADATRLNRLLYKLLLPVGLKSADLRSTEDKPAYFWRFLYSLANIVLFRDLRDKLGLSKIRVAYSAGAPISPDIIRFFQGIGINIKQGYGGSEQGLVSLPPDDDIRAETSGKILPRIEVRLAHDGEILIRGQNMFCGYYKDIAATEEKVKNGWYYSGDFGYITEEGHLIVMDRMADLRELSSGEKFSPQYAEIRLRFSPYIKDVLVVGGEKRDYVICIVNIDIDNVGRWAEARKIAYTTFTDLSQKPEVIYLIRRDIERVNRTLPEWARIKRFANLHREFDPDESELTRTRKIRRAFVEERYHNLIEAMYEGVEELNIEAPITYRDGRKGTIRTVIKVESLS